MRIFVLGTRGIPDIQGGVEQHCENLYPLIASEECQVTIFRRNPYIVNHDKTYNNIRFIDLPSTRIHGFEAFYHSFLCSVVCIFKRPDIVHIHNIGPGFFVPILKMAGLKVVMTYHSPNYEHLKWSKGTKYFLKNSEIISTKYSDKVIFVSLYQKDKLGNKENYVHINNGVRTLPITSDFDYIESLGLKRRKYILAVGRFVEEKGFDLLMKAYGKTDHKDIKLVIAGHSDHETAYSNTLQELAKANGVILPGFVRGAKLQQLFSHAMLFVLPSYSEGLPIALLEAMNYHLPVLASNIPANLQVSLPGNRYFSVGDEKSLIESLDQQLNKDSFEPSDYDMTPYNWDQIAELTKDVYKELLND